MVPFRVGPIEMRFDSLINTAVLAIVMILCTKSLNKRIERNDRDAQMRDQLSQSKYEAIAAHEKVLIDELVALQVRQRTLQDQEAEATGRLEIIIGELTKKRIQVP